MRVFVKLAICILLVISCCASKAQAPSIYDQHEAFRPFFYPTDGNSIHSADGTPGPDYWQNRADYNIEASLDDSLHTITGSVVVAYTNNSPQQLAFVWLQLDQNINRPTSKGNSTMVFKQSSMFGNKDTSGGYHITAVAILQNGKETNLGYDIYDTKMRIKLPTAMPAKGGKVKLKIRYNFKVPLNGFNRMGRLKEKQGWMYEIAQWYPRMCVYDDKNGWNTLPYLGQGEFYLEYGDINYSINVPDGYLVAGSGELLNPKEMLTSIQQKRLVIAQASDSTIMVRTVAEAADTLVQYDSKKTKTWRFRCLNTRDVALSASRAFVWDAAKMNLPEGKSKLAMSFYPVESADKNGWKHSTQFVKTAVEFYSTYLCPFPYPVATSVAGIAGGMEYPGIVFCAAGTTGSELWQVVSHEIGHTWFPMILGSNERKFAWMDEGMNTFINNLADRYVYKGIYKNKKTVQELAIGMFKDSNESVMTLPDVQPVYNYGLLAYHKPALGLQILRETILGPERFDSAFNYYLTHWAYKHPSPYDFFHCMENYTGETLDWFWRGWFLNVWKVDMAISEVTFRKGIGSIITIINLQKMPMPVMISVTDSSGKTDRVSLPVEIWQRGNTWRFLYPSKEPLQQLILDPDGNLPDINIKNNSWPVVDNPKSSFKTEKSN